MVDGVDKVERAGRRLKSTFNSDVGEQKIRTGKRYYLCSPFEGVYLTFREAQCVHYTEVGFTMSDIAVRLGLSPRTVEYYVANVKRKLRVRSKEELLLALKQTHFRFFSS